MNNEILDAIDSLKDSDLGAGLGIGFLPFILALNNKTNIPKKKVPTGYIGKGIEMRHYEHKDKNNKSNYCQLYKDDKKISDYFYRQGGFFSGFFSGSYDNKKEVDFCCIIRYKDITKDSGTHVIIDENANEIITAENSLDYPCFIGGILGNYKKEIYNLKTKEVICGVDKSVSTDEFLFAEQNCGRIYKYKTPDGVYKINYLTGEYEFFPKTK